MRPDAVAIICTRPESSRLPRKCFRKIAGLSALEHILTRLDRLSPPIPTILAIPDNLYAADFNEYADLADRWPWVRLYAGNPESPLHRMMDALKGDPLPEFVVRITHDDILIDAETVEALLHETARNGAGYGITPAIIEGAGVEVIHAENLKFARDHAVSNVEHVSYYVRGQGMPRPRYYEMKPRPTIARPYRLTLDYMADLVVLETVLRSVGPLASNDEIAAFLDQNPHVLKYNRRPWVSVYTCARDAGRWISRTLLSVQEALGPEGQYIIVDDGSKDDTLLKAMDHVWHTLNAELFVNEENLGLASASNIALARCKGRYVMRVDADDTLRPWALESMLAKIQETGAAIVYAGYDEIDADGRVVAAGIDPRRDHHAGCALMDLKFIQELRYKDGLRHWDSLDLFRRIDGRFPIAYIDEPLWFYRRHEKSLSAARTPEREAVRLEIMTDSTAFTGGVVNA